ncbi:MAG: CBS domain-containing protein [Rhodopirellula sp.]|nr:CBS domain-containing protein [Rhodopirellula sp.]
MNPYSELLAQDVMNSPVLSTSPETDVDDVEQEFVRHGVSAMPVVQQGQIVGIISRSDLMLVPVLAAAIESGVTAAGIISQPKPVFLVRDIMTRQVVQCSPETELGLVAADMVHQHVHHIVVVRDGLAVGVISSLDIVQLTVQ